MVLDTVGAPYLQKNCEALAMDGKIVLIGWMGGMTVKEFDLMIMIKKRVTLIGARPCHSCPPQTSWLFGVMCSVSVSVSANSAHSETVDASIFRAVQFA